ncbi:hypothetical protein ES711_11920 [Gelidibacter salicanalis]|uniref:Uncharacterized protein n=1 Tax=Gelidibacter salicanalis TaxID=291193 RepID=A0A5C7AFA6_9FLAO|nr:hypothetical protein [Gelidibacter salicanalis]TXE07466.1 hypothetical protein ES711_11920 [Gelidibacter salicanalis]
MDYKTFIKRDYVLVLLISVLYFLTVKNVVPVVAYLVIAVISSIYFFPVKLFLGDAFDNTSKKKHILAALSYFVTSNIITLTASVFFQEESGFVHTTLGIYALINLGFLFYFYWTEKSRYNVILCCCVLVLTSAKFAI